MLLIKVADGCHLWSERYEGDLSDIFASHEKISTGVQRTLQTQVLGPRLRSAGRMRPQSIEAYNL